MGQGKGLYIAAFLSTWCASSGARAVTLCLELDTQRDNLAEDERAATRTLLVQTLEDKGQSVVTQGCQRTYSVYHIRLGSSVTVVLSDGSTSRSLKVSKIEDVPRAYSQLVESLLTGKPLGIEAGAIDRNNVTSAQVAPNRVEADSLGYLRLGYGGVAARGLKMGPAFGFGYRYELDRIGIDASFFNFTLIKRGSSYDDRSGTWIRLGAVYYFDAFANSSLYAGGGVGLGAGNAWVDGTNYENSGIDFGLSGGLEFLRASTIRIFLQFDADLPSYSLGGDVYDASRLTSHKDSFYAPSFSLSVGLGFGKANTIRVQKLD
jgi:hypothetical protein